MKEQVLSLVVLSMACGPAFGGTGKAGASYALQYEGGSVGLKQHRTLKATVANNEVVFVQHGRRLSVPVQEISEVSCATSVHRRFGAAVLGLVPRMELDKAREHYVGVTWIDETGSGSDRGRSDVVLKLNAGEYRNFVATLDRLTGKQAVDTGKTPTVVRYQSRQMRP